MSRTPRILFAVAALLGALTAGTSAAPAPAAASPGAGTAKEAPASPQPRSPLPEWSGSVLGGTELEFPGRSRTIAFESIAPGSNFSLGLDTEGNAWSWGINGFGQLGNSEYIGRYIFAPYPVPMLDSAGEQLRATGMSASGNFSVVLDEAGKAWTYGRNNFGQLGNPSVPTGDVIAGKVTPVPVQDATGRQMTFSQVSAGTSFAFGLEADGSAWAWGRNYYGQLGGVSNGSVFITPVSTVATPVLDASGAPMRFASIEGGEDFAIGIDLDGKAWGWGDNSSGQLGSPGGTTGRPRPVLDGAGDQLSFTQVAAGYTNAYGLDAQGRVWSWGSDTEGALGNPAAAGDTSVPIPVLDEGGDQLRLRSLSTWDLTVFGIDLDGTVVAWGSNGYGQLGRTPAELASSEIPLRLSRSPGVPLKADKVYAGTSHATMIGDFDLAALTNAWAWGAAWYGQLGNPDVDTSLGAYRTSPVTISLPQPSTDSIVYFGDDDTVGVTGTMVDGKLVVEAPRHLAGRVPVYVAWFGDEPTREHVGYFTFLLKPSLAMQPNTLDIDATSQAVVTLPDEEIPLIGAAKMRFTLGDAKLTVPGGDPAVTAPMIAFDANGRAVLPVTSHDPGTYPVGAQAVIDLPSDPITHDVPVSDALRALVSFEAQVIVTPPARSKYGSVTVNKVDQDDHPLAGAKFAIYYSHLENPDFSITDNADTGARATGLVCDMTTGDATSCTFRARYSDWAEGVQLQSGDRRWNYYWLVEVVAPAGYELLAEKIPFQITKDTVDADHINPDIDVVNVRSSTLLLPFTGGDGTGVFVFAGVGLGALAVGLTLLRRRRMARATPVE